MLRHNWGRPAASETLVCRQSMGPLLTSMGSIMANHENKYILSRAVKIENISSQDLPIRNLKNHLWISVPGKYRLIAD